MTGSRLFSRRSSLTALIVSTAAIGFAGFSGASAARGDVKIVTKASFSGGPSGASRDGGNAMTSTTYYKGDRFRTEMGDTVMIYDCAADRMYTLDTAKKTYMVATLKQMAAAGQSNPMMAMLDMKSTVSMKPGGKTKVIAGKPATNYVWKATVSMSMKKGAGGAPQGAAMPALPTLILEGENWTTQALKTSARCGRINGAAMMGGGLPPGMQKLIEMFGQMKGIPLSSRMTQRMKFSGPAPAGMPAGANKPTVITSSVVSLSEATLPDSLFAVPKGYKQVPRSSAMPMPRRGGGAPMRR